MTTIKLRGKVNFPASVTASGGLQVVKNNGAWTISPNFAGLTSISASSVADPSTQQVWIYKPSDNSYAVLTLAGLGDALYKATSTTSFLIGTGSKVFTTQSNKDFGVGSYVIATSDANPATNYMSGQITAYSGANLTTNITATGGSGTYADWTLRASGSAGSTGSTGATGPGYLATSVTSNTIASSGSKTFTTQSGLAYVAGTRVRAADSGAPSTNYMEGVVTSYSGTTLIFTADRSAGSGTLISWNLGIAGDQGATGVTGSTGPTGPGYAATSVTSNTIANTGAKTFTTQSGLAYASGVRVRAADASLPSTNFMEGVVTSYSGTTLTFTADLSVGSGTLTNWVIGATGQQGPTGPSGALGVSGTPTVNQFGTWLNATTMQGVSITGLVKGNGASAPAAAVQGTDYYAPSGTDVAVADGGTGSSTAAGARTNLGSTTVGDALFIAASVAAGRTALTLTPDTDIPSQASFNAQVSRMSTYLRNNFGGL